MASPLSIAEVNSLGADQFEWTFRNVIELCSEAAERVQRWRPFETISDLCEAFAEYLDGLEDEEKVVVLKLHPDLAGKMAASGELTRESSCEQRSAGLQDLTEDEKRTMDISNDKYKSKYGFPFIICARENKVKSIMNGLQKRFHNTREQEIQTAINEVKKICKLRVLDIVRDD